MSARAVETAETAARAAKPAPARIRIGHVPIDALRFEETIQAILQLVERGEGGTVMTPNVDHVVLAEDDLELRAAYAEVSVSLVDGKVLFEAARLLGHRLPEKVSGSDLFEPLVGYAAAFGKRVFLLGAAPGIAERTAARLVEEFPSLIVAGTDAPSLDLQHDSPTHDAIVAELRAARPDLVFLAFGCPKQEILMHRIARAVRPAVLIGVGASFDFVAGAVQRAPEWASEHGLEWLYRLVHEPLRLAPRYLVRDPRFLAILVREIVARRHAKAA
jgi:N-acetylglucosaminyldiphosphoundecaprenol N-acetyl-beta-D-mannosaminyltransferase